MPRKTKARDIIPGWPRGRSTSAFTGVRYYDSVDGSRYREMRLPWERQPNGSVTNPFTDWLQRWIITPDFRRPTEQALESEYRAGQQKMADDYRARYRTLTEEDKAWLRYPGGEPLREAIKSNFYKQYIQSLTGRPLPLGTLLAIKASAENDKSFLLRVRIAAISGGGSYEVG